MQTKKLSLDDKKKSVLISALSETAEAMDKDMRKIYDDTAEQVRHASDRVLLTYAQAEIVKHALRHDLSKPDARAMLDQLVLTRAEYTAKYPGVA